MKPAVVKKTDSAQNERKRPTLDLAKVDGAAVPVALLVSRNRFRSAAGELGSAYLRLRCRAAEMAIFVAKMDWLPSIACNRVDRLHADQPGLA